MMRMRPTRDMAKSFFRRCDRQSFPTCVGWSAEIGQGKRGRKWVPELLQVEREDVRVLENHFVQFERGGPEMFRENLPKEADQSKEQEGASSQVDGRENEMVNSMLNVLARMAIADGVLDDHEIHDLGETAIACCIHLGVKSSSKVLEVLNGWLDDWKEKMEENREEFMLENTEEFGRITREINRNCTPSEKRQILRLCQIIAASDGDVEEHEQPCWIWRKRTSPWRRYPVPWPQIEVKDETVNWCVERP